MTAAALSSTRRHHRRRHHHLHSRFPPLLHPHSRNQRHRPAPPIAYLDAPDAPFLHAAPKTLSPHSLATRLLPLRPRHASQQRSPPPNLARLRRSRPRRRRRISQHSARLYRSSSPSRFPQSNFSPSPSSSAFCFLDGIRFAFEMPADLRASWIFKSGSTATPKTRAPSPAAFIHALTLSWLAPATFAARSTSSVWQNARSPYRHPHRRHNALLAEILHRKFPQNPLHLPLPAIRKPSGLILVAYLSASSSSPTTSRT